MAMQLTMEILFFGSIFLIFYSYIGYPLSLYVIGLFVRRDVKKSLHFPQITMIITAYNEEKRIKEKLENTLAIEYPEEKLQIIIASDGSTDGTDFCVESYRKANMELLSLPVRSGKENAQKEAFKKAKGDIIVFTDVATLLEPKSLEKIVSNFADPTVGCVSSEDRLVERHGVPSGEGSYVRYEMFLRRLESKVNSLVGLSGSFFAARKTACRDFSGEMQSDFRTLLNCIKMGQRGVTDPEVTGTYLDVSERKREFDRKVRTVLRGLTVFFEHMEFLNIGKYGFFSYQFFCHKLLRWLVPLFLIVTLVSNIFLLPRADIYVLFFLGQLSFYIFALLGWRWKHTSSVILKIPYYFLTVNVSILMAWWRYFRRERIVMWTPSER